ncbi:MAG: FliH/SctL family protein [Pseudomonadota bacterium]
MSSDAARDTVTFIDQREVSVAVDNGRVSARSWAALEDVDAVVKKANAVYARAREDAKRIREEARQQGLKEGQEQAQFELARDYAALAKQRDRLLTDLDDQVAELALAVAAKIAPTLGADAVVPALVARAIDAARAENVLRLRVHPATRDAVCAALAQMTLPNPGAPLDVVNDDELDTYSCVLETSAGTVRAGWQNQLEAVRHAFELAAGESAGAR